MFELNSGNYEIHWNGNRGSNSYEVTRKDKDGVVILCAIDFISPYGYAIEWFDAGINEYDSVVELVDNFCNKMVEELLEIRYEREMDWKYEEREWLYDEEGTEEWDDFDF